MTIQEACQRLGKSESTIRRWIRQSKLDAIKINGLWDIPDAAINDYLNDQSPAGSDQSDDYPDDQSPADNDQSSDQRFIDRIEQENAYLKDRIQEMEAARERSDTVVLQMTRQLEQSQRLLEHHQEPWYRRVFRKREVKGDG